ncbi:MAG: hydroxymethylbilane synthase, partial [Candidatus Methylomirabilis sp.]|nr:hydroxymethylbilane synthase [Deltaproteobacteria bacterium]
MATRGSRLALTQSRWFAERLKEAHPGLEVEVRVLKTQGDKITDVPLAQVGGSKGFFVKELEDALLSGEADLAVHSMKDMPAELPKGLVIAATPRREDPRDAWIAAGGKSLKDLPAGARVGTSSLRRKVQVRALRPDLALDDLRGNIDTRLRKAEGGEFDAIILAMAGLRRMGWEARATEVLDPESFIPAIGQGALAIETREGSEAADLVRALEDRDARDATDAERGLLRRLEGGCQLPLAAHATVDGERLR